MQKIKWYILKTFLVNVLKEIYFILYDLVIKMKRLKAKFPRVCNQA